MSKPIVMNDNLYQYMIDNSIRLHPTEAELRAETANLSNAKMLSAPEATQFLTVFMHAMQAKRIIEVGVFTGATTLAMALNIPEDGYILACDNNEEYCAIAQKYWDKAEISNKIDLQIANATDTLKKYIDEGQSNSFDFAFIDANKKGYPEYYELCYELLRTGGVMVFDNALQCGRVADMEQQDNITNVIREVLEKIHNDDRMDTCLIPVADGMAIGVKR